ncbi:hypothetical protein GCM10023231_19970 [Olivibacter ginsenosidimutans]|uniref:Uncharacterized protein n=1 Tax=Olivibacter ginsenosidimutans TaxID=1176537 RepID=A0ABP9B887_9SPHI
MKTTTTKTANALLRKNGEFIVKDQIIFQYPKPMTTKQVKAQVEYLLGKKALRATVEVKQLDKNKHIFHIFGPGVHSWGEEKFIGGYLKNKPIPPPPPPIIPSLIFPNTVIIQQTGLKNLPLFKADILK